MPEKRTAKQIFKQKSAELLLKVVDRGNAIIDIATKAGVAYIGYKGMNHWSGALMALVGYRLAQSPNLVSGGAGVTILTTLGLSSAIQALANAQKPTGMMWQR